MYSVDVDLPYTLERRAPTCCVFDGPKPSVGTIDFSLSGQPIVLSIFGLGRDTVCARGTLWGRRVSVSVGRRDSAGRTPPVNGNRRFAGDCKRNGPWSRFGFSRERRTGARSSRSNRSPYNELLQIPRVFVVRVSSHCVRTLN